MLIDAECFRIGKSVAFTHANMYAESNMSLICSGRHLKAMMNEPFFND